MFRALLVRFKQVESRCRNSLFIKCLAVTFLCDELTSAVYCDKSLRFIASDTYDSFGTQFLRSRRNFRAVIYTNCVCFSVCTIEMLINPKAFAQDSFSYNTRDCRRHDEFFLNFLGAIKSYNCNVLKKVETKVESRKL